MRILPTILLIVLALLTSSCSKMFVDFVSEPSENIEAPADLVFLNQSAECESYEWDFGDGTSSSDSSPSHRYLLSGTYTVTLQGKKKNKIKETQKMIDVKAPDRCLALIETPMGNMIVELFDDTPKHRDNFVKLAEEGFYDDLLFHRVIEGFMVQGGDPNSRDAGREVRLGSGGPGYQIDAEFTTKKAHVKGALAAARMGDQVNPERKSSGSQFYIVQGRAVTENELARMETVLSMAYPADIRKSYVESGGTPFLDQQYTVFGQVIEGLDVIDQIASSVTDRSDRPEENITMKIKIIK